MIVLVQISILFPILADQPAVPVYAGSAEESATAQKYRFIPDPQLPNVLLLGDSISIGYTLTVRQDLKNSANVYRPMKEDGTPENCGDSARWVRGDLDRWLQTNLKWDVIHFNVGLHDLKRVDPVKGADSDDPSKPHLIGLETYKNNLEQIVRRLEKTGARLIFATTTPSVVTAHPLMLPEDVAVYNAAAFEIMRQHGVAIDDLYSKVLPEQTKLQIPDNVHFKNEGNIFLGREVSRAVKDALPKK